MFRHYRQYEGMTEEEVSADLRARGPAPSAYVTAVVRGVRRAISVFGQV